MPSLLVEEWWSSNQHSIVWISTATASLPSPWQSAHRAWHFSPLPLAFARNIVKFIAFEEFPGRKQSSKNLTFEESVHTSLGGCYYMSLVFEDCMRVGFSTFAKSVMKTAQLKEAQNQSTWKPKLLFELEADLLLLDKIEFTEMVKTQQSSFDSDIQIFTISTDSPEKFFIQKNPPQRLGLAKGTTHHLPGNGADPRRTTLKRIQWNGIQVNLSLPDPKMV